MRLLIDGYNLLHATRWLDAEGTDSSRPDIRAQELRLIDRLSEKCRGLFSRCTIVFDAKRSPPLWIARRERIKGIEVIRALDHPSADELLIDMIMRDTGPRDLVVVSTDREIRSAARQRGAEVKSSEQFWRWIDELRARQAVTPDEAKELEKPSIVSAEEKRWALREFSEPGPTAPQADPKARRPRRRRFHFPRHRKRPRP